MSHHILNRYLKFIIRRIHVMKKIAIIIQALRGGGAERTAANMSIDLSSAFEVHLIVFDADKISFKYGGTLHRLDLPSRKSNYHKIMTFFKRLYAVRKIKKEIGFDCCISLMEGANLVNILTKQRERIVVSERNLISFFVKKRIHKALVKYIHKKADVVVSLSEFVRRDLIRNFNDNPQKVVTIYNSVDISKFNLTDSDEIVNHPYIVTMGRLTYQKAQWHIIKAFSKLTLKYPQLKLAILGEGELRSQLELLVKNLKISDKVLFLGYQKRPHLIIKNAEFFVFSSVVEGLGSVLLEALACGKAIISTDCDAGPREILAPSTDIEKKTSSIEHGDYGVLVPVDLNNEFSPSNIQLTEKEMIMSSAIDELMRDLDLRGDYERKSAIRVEDFSPAKISKDWIDLIFGLING